MHMHIMGMDMTMTDIIVLLLRDADVLLRVSVSEVIAG